MPASRGFVMEAGGVDIVDMTLTPPAGMSPGDEVDLLVSDPYDNTHADKSVAVTVLYSAITPESGQWQLQACVETANPATGKWHRVAHQNESLFRADIGPERKIILDPTLTILDVGLDEIVFVLDREVGHVSRHQGVYPEEGIRVRVSLRDYDPGGPGGLTSVDVSVFGEGYSG